MCCVEVREGTAVVAMGKRYLLVVIATDGASVFIYLRGLNGCSRVVEQLG